jgi:hypothetical protein
MNRMGDASFLRCPGEAFRALYRMRVVCIMVSAFFCGVQAQDTVDATTLVGKYMFGYQGWFWAPGDGSGTAWADHWFRNSDATAKDIVVDMYPDMWELGTDELFSTGLHMSDSSPAMLYSAYVEKTVMRHFKWMRDYQVDGVWVQRFIGYALSPTTGPKFNQVMRNCKKGAETYGRVFVVMYDLSGGNNANIGRLKNDWMYLVDSLHVTESPRYLRHKGKPLVSLWGLAFSDRPQPAPDSLIATVRWFQSGAPAKYQATVMGGTNDNWRTVGAPWTATATCCDIISPWLVGRFNDTNGANTWKNNVLVPDIAEANRLGKEYLPVIWPGFSWHNLYPTYASNQIKRLGGKFFWTQVYNSISAGATMLYNAMFDEVNEGTAMYKIVPKRSMAPLEATWVTLDADGYNLPSDWYLRLACYAKKMLNRQIPLSKTMPIDPLRPDSLWNGIAVQQSGAHPLPGRPLTLRNGVLSMTHTAKEAGTIGLYRLDGRKLRMVGYRFVEGTNRIPLYSKGEISPGIYILKIQAGGREIVEKAIVAAG